MGVYCKNCGMYYNENVAFCENCGSMLVGDPAQRAEIVRNTPGMTPEDAIFTFWKRYSDFGGRSRRSEFWYSVLVNWIIAIFINLIGILLPVNLGMVISTVFTAMLFLPNIAIAIRRVHDTGKSGWVLFAGFIPVIGAIWLIILFSLDGEKRANEYGESPKYFVSY